MVIIINNESIFKVGEKKKKKKKYNRYRTFG